MPIAHQGLMVTYQIYEKLVDDGLAVFVLMNYKTYVRVIPFTDNTTSSHYWVMKILDKPLTPLCKFTINHCRHIWSMSVMLENSWKVKTNFFRQKLKPFESPDTLT